MQQQNLTLGNLTVQNVTQRTISIIGGKGTGKTTTLKMLAVNSPVPCIIFDPLNVVKIKGWNRLIVTKQTIQKGRESGELLNKYKKDHFIVSFANLLQREQTEFLDGFFSGWRPENCLIAIDEIHEATPQVGLGEGYSDEVQRAIRHWRNRNVGFILTSQRPAQVDKNVLGLTDYLILYRMTWSNDLEAVKKLLQNGLPSDSTKAVLSGVQTKGFLNGYAIDFVPNSQF